MRRVKDLEQLVSCGTGWTGRHTLIMGILDGAATDLQAKLERAGVRSSLAYALGHLSYAREQSIPSWIAPPTVSRAEITWLVSEYVKELRRGHDDLSRITIIQGLCTKVFGQNGEEMFIAAYPEFSEDQWEATLARMLSVPSDPIPSAAPAGWYADPYGVPCLRWWNGSVWTDQCRPTTTAAAPAEYSPKPKQSNGLAITGFGLGVASFFLFAIPILGILLTLSALAVSSFGLAMQTPQHAKSGKVLGIIGASLGGLYTLMYIIFVATGRM